MKNLAGCLGLILGGIGMIVLLALVMALPTMWLWNALIPDITKNAVTDLTFWQALGLNFLCGILFKSSASASSKSD